MERNDNLKIVLLGSGNVAWHLGNALRNNNIEILQIYSQHEEHARALGKEWHLAHTSELTNLNAQADMYIFALKDDAYQDMILHFPFRDACLVHTSGSVDMSVFEPLSIHRGVLYPFQTFTKGISLSFEEVPLCIEANNKQVEETLRFLAGKISKHYFMIDGNQRKQLHLAGVFACNFTNAMYAIAKKILKEKNLEFDMLLPLITETARKVTRHAPEQVQTGPSVRQDQSIIDKHLDMIEDKNIKELYVLMTKIIQEKI